MIDIVVRELRNHGHGMKITSDNLEHMIDLLESYMEDYDAMKDTLWRQFYNQCKVLEYTINLIESYGLLKKNLYYDDDDATFWGVINETTKVLKDMQKEMIYNNLKFVEYAHDSDDCNGIADEHPNVKEMADSILDDYGRVINNQISKELGLL
jgi:hypothetical protein